MIVVDTSALMAIIGDEDGRDKCLFALNAVADIKISAGTLVEAYVASEYRGVGHLMARLVSELRLDVVPATAETAELARFAFQRWGKGRHPAKLNFGDCFSYALAKDLEAPLLFIGNDFSQTDIESVL